MSDLEVADTYGVPFSVVYSLRVALTRVAHIERERAGYKRIGMGDRYDADLDLAAAPHAETIAEFRTYAPLNGVDPDAVIAALTPEAPR